LRLLRYTILATALKRLLGKRCRVLLGSDASEQQLDTLEDAGARAADWEARLRPALVLLREVAQPPWRVLREQTNDLHGARAALLAGRLGEGAVIVGQPVGRAARATDRR
jgi:hypothetical protein